MSDTYESGKKVPYTGDYKEIHTGKDLRPCSQTDKVVELKKGATFPSCTECGEGAFKFLRLAPHPAKK